MPKVPELSLRNVIKEPLSADEIRKLAKRAGGPKLLVAPKRRSEAEALDGEELIEWLAADGARLRRPIIETGKGLTLGFTAESRQALELLLP